MNRNRIADCIWLFAVNLFISAFTFGGGYVVIPMIRKFFVQKRQYFDEKELADLAAIAQSSPGAIAVNLAVLAGYRTAGMAGALISCAASILPPLVILSVVSGCYSMIRDNPVISSVLRGMEAGVAALIVDLVVDMARAIFQEKNRLLSLMVPAAFLASWLFQINAAVILLACCGVCLLSLARGWKGGIAIGKDL